MEEGWIEKPKANRTGARFVDTMVLHIWQMVKALVSYGTDFEAVLRMFVLGLGEKGLSDHERRKHEFIKSSDKHSKLKQVITPFRSWRVGFTLLLFIAIGMVGFLSQNSSLHHLDIEFERTILSTQVNRERWMAQLEANLTQNDESNPVSSLTRRAASGALKVGLLNLEPTTDLGAWKFLLNGSPVTVPFEKVAGDVEWKDLFPTWIDEEGRYGTPRCPVYPMPKIPVIPYVSSTVELDMVIARAPCAESNYTLQEAWRHPALLQVLLGAAHLAAETGHESIYVLILSKCRPLVNLFPCGELLLHRDDAWLYQMNVKQLRKRTSLPVGTCQLSVSLGSRFYKSDHVAIPDDFNSKNEAFVTVLHSHSDYVCGAIALAQSIRRTGSTRDLVVLVDSSISSEQRKGLKEAGWKVRDYVKLSASESSGKQKDFSMLRLWQLDYEKVIYLDADIIVLRNIDHLFKLSEIAGSGTTASLFNSGVIVIHPSNCTFRILMDEMEKLVSEVKDEWDFLNRVFPWWHRIPLHMNAQKYFWSRTAQNVDYMNRMFASNPPKLYAIHYVRGVKPWNCYRDYDCNWNTDDHYASDEAHAQWFKVYDQMPQNLQKYCALSTRAKTELEEHRKVAESNNFPDNHWAINITDPRLDVCQGDHCDWNLCQQNHCDWNAMQKTINPTVNSSNPVDTTVTSTEAASDPVNTTTTEIVSDPVHTTTETTEVASVK